MLSPAPSTVSQTKEYILKASIITRSWKIDVAHQKEREKEDKFVRLLCSS